MKSLCNHWLCDKCTPDLVKGMMNNFLLNIAKIYSLNKTEDSVSFYVKSGVLCKIFINNMYKFTFILPSD